MDRTGKSPRTPLVSRSELNNGSLQEDRRLLAFMKHIDNKPKWKLAADTIGNGRTGEQVR